MCEDPPSRVLAQDLCQMRSWTEVCPILSVDFGVNHRLRSMPHTLPAPRLVRSPCQKRPHSRGFCGEGGVVKGGISKKVHPLALGCVACVTQKKQGS
jgi:hypothetical protein